MADKDKDVEAGTPRYEEVASPSSASEQEERAARVGASIPKLLIAALPNLAISMARSAEWAAVGPQLLYLLPEPVVKGTRYIAPLTSLLVSPIIGASSDRCLSRLGRRRPYLIVGAIAAAVCLIAMGYTKEISEAISGDVTEYSWDSTTISVLIVLFYLWLEIALNIIAIPTLLLVADLAGERQVVGSAIAQGWTVVGSIAVSVYLELAGEAYEHIHYYMALLAAVVIVAVGFACLVVKEKKLTGHRWTGVMAHFGKVFLMIYKALRTLPPTVILYGGMLLVVGFGYSVYAAAKTGFFIFELFQGSPIGAVDCEPICTKAQDDYNRAWRLLGYKAEIVYDSITYLYLCILPFLIKRFGAKLTLTGSLVPQALLIIVAFTTVVPLTLIVTTTAMWSRNILYTLIVPLIIHVLGRTKDIGAQVGVLTTITAIGQLLIVMIGTAMVESSMGYKLPVFLGGIFGAVGVFITWFFFNVKMHA